MSLTSSKWLGLLAVGTKLNPLLRSEIWVSVSVTQQVDNILFGTGYIVVINTGIKVMVISSYTYD